MKDFSSGQRPRSSECGCLMVLRSFSPRLAATPEEFAHSDNAQLRECAAVQWSIIFISTWHCCQSFVSTSAGSRVKRWSPKRRTADWKWPTTHPHRLLQLASHMCRKEARGRGNGRVHRRWLHFDGFVGRRQCQVDMEERRGLWTTVDAMCQRTTLSDADTLLKVDDDGFPFFWFAVYDRS